MTTSISSLLQVVNRVLLNNGEREQRLLNTPTSYLARDCVRDALEELSLGDDWEWARERVTPVFTDWTSNTVRIRNVHRIHAVSYFDSTFQAHQPVDFIDEVSFDQHPSPPATQRVPCFFTQLDDERFKFDVTPTNLEVSNYRFYLTRRNIMPTLETDLFNISEQGIPLLVSLASSKFGQRHTGETTNADRFLQEYQRQADGVRQHKRTRPSKPFNIYRRR
jgi:hypothetical protein